MLSRMFRVIIAVIGIFIIAISILGPGPFGGMDSPIWGVLLGIGLVIMPLTALAMLLAYFLMVGIPLGLAFLSAIAFANLFEKSGALVIVGFAIGGFVGFRVILSDAFDRLMNPVRNFANGGKV